MQTDSKFLATWTFRASSTICTMPPNTEDNHDVDQDSSFPMEYEEPLDKSSIDLDTTNRVSTYDCQALSKEK
jgi:hypothetical protein